ncbi:MAG: hypothetical protein HY907_00850 [Deltaproteobacteria bacterium]|nr:hypothetical protein [Deltaproteobacteria bacterium]
MAFVLGVPEDPDASGGHLAPPSHESAGAVGASAAGESDTEVGKPVDVDAGDTAPPATPPGFSCKKCGASVTEPVWRSPTSDGVGSRRLAGMAVGVVLFAVARWVTGPMFGFRPTIGGLLLAIGGALIAAAATVTWRCARCGTQLDESQIPAGRRVKRQHRRLSLGAIGMGCVAVGMPLIWPIVFTPVVRHQSPQGTYSAELPRTHWDVARKDERLPTATGSTRMVSYTAVNEHQPIAVFGLAWVPLAPLPPGQVRNRRDVLERLVSELARTRACTPGRTHDVAQASCEGIDVRVTCVGDEEGALHGRYRYLLCGDEFVSLGFLGKRPDIAGDEDGRDFLESFRFERVAGP